MLPAALLQRDLHVAITGANGWIGRMALAMLEEAFGEAVAERVSLFGSRARDIATPGGRVLAGRPLAEMAGLVPVPTLLLHLAFETKDRVGAYSPEEFLRRNAAIDDAVLAAAQKLPLVGVFVPSSGAVYRADRTLEIDTVANPYGAMKVLQERRWRDWSDTNGVRLVLVRVFNLAGPFINKFDTYALASILVALLRGEPIRLKADRPVIRSYVHIRDLVQLVFSVLLDAARPVLPAFDTVGAEEIEVGELARRAAAVLGRLEHPIVRPPVKSEPVNRYVGEGPAWGQCLAQHAIAPTPLAAQIADTAAYLETVIG